MNNSPGAKSLYKTPETLRMLDDVCCYYLQKTVRELFSETLSIEKNNLFNTLSIAPKYHRLFNFILHTLAQKGFTMDDGLRIHQPHKNALSTHEKENLRATLIDQGHRPILDMLEHCLQQYPSILRGEMQALPFLFPNGKVSLLFDTLITHSKQYSNETTLPLLLSKMITAPEETKMIDIGAGQGLFAWPFLKNLATPPKEYLYTDIGQTFLLDAREKCESLDYSFMDFKKLDITQPIPEQQKNKYDYAIASNVMHATKNIQTSLKHTFDLLKPTGSLILMELCYPYLWQHLIWGLLPGWWEFNNDERQLIPTLEPAAWISALKESGFQNIQIYPNPPQKITERSEDSFLFIAHKK